MAFILPLPVTVADYAAGLRTLVETYRIIEIIDFEPMRRVMFRGIKRPVMALIVEKCAPAADDVIRLRLMDASCYDADNDIVLVDSAVATTVDRSDFIDLYAPTSFDEEDEEEEGSSDGSAVEDEA